MAENKLEIRLAITPDARAVSIMIFGAEPITAASLKDVLKQYLELPVFNQPEETTEVTPDAPATT